MAKRTAADLCAAGQEEFVAAVGGVYEKSAWIAERGFARGPYGSLTSLAAGLKAVVDESTEVRPRTNVNPSCSPPLARSRAFQTSQEEQRALLRAHPDLAGKAALAGSLTAESAEEQARAGLGSLTEDEMARFTEMNSRYASKFGFPFILAIRNAKKRTILNAFATRIDSPPGVELAECLAQVHKIAWMRLREVVAAESTGKLTCHVLDTARGKPAAGMAVSLRRLSEAAGAETWSVVGQVTEPRSAPAPRARLYHAPPLPPPPPRAATRRHQYDRSHRLAAVTPPRLLLTAPLARSLSPTPMAVSMGLRCRARRSPPAHMSGHSTSVTTLQAQRCRRQALLFLERCARTDAQRLGVVAAPQTAFASCWRLPNNVARLCAGAASVWHRQP